MVRADTFQALCWVALSLLALLVGAGQRKRRVYYPANLLLGLSVGAPMVFYITLLAIFQNIADVRVFAVTYRIVLLLYPIQILLMLWAWLLVMRVGRLKPGDCVDILGRIQPPTDFQIEDALIIVGRAEKHGMLTEVTKKWLREDVEIRRVISMAQDRRERNNGNLAHDHVRLLFSLVWRNTFGGGRVRLTKRLRERFPKESFDEFDHPDRRKADRPGPDSR